jgi:hypothetical protein
LNPELERLQKRDSYSKESVQNDSSIPLDRCSGARTAARIIPMARGLILCDYHIGNPEGKTDVYGIFNGIHSESGFPYYDARFCAFAQLANGPGRIPFHIDVRLAETDELIWTSETNQLTFPNRQRIVQVVQLIEHCTFHRAGLYLVSLFCDNRWICDTPLNLR